MPVSCSQVAVERGAMRWGWICLGLAMFIGLRAAAAQPTPPAVIDQKPRRLALLVGVGRYTKDVPVNKKAWRQLNTHSEIVKLRDVLQKRHEFLPADIKILEDSATAKGQDIRDQFQKHLIDQAKPGSVVFFHFSGHGQQLPDKNGDEYDGLDESLVPADAVDQSIESGAKKNILDDEIAKWLELLTKNMRGPSGKVEGSIVLSFDTCFAGSLQRGDLIERGRGWDEKDDGPRPPVGQRSGPPGANATALLDRGANDYVLLSASRNDQTARERDGAGLYSRALASALERLPREISYRTLMHEVMVAVRLQIKDQTPNWEGDADRGLFGTPFVKPLPSFLPVLAVAGARIQLPVGSLQLIAEGSIYSLYEKGEAPLGPASLLGDAKVVEVGSTTSWLQFQPAGRRRVSDADLQNARAVEKQRVYKDTPLRVRCQDERGGGCAPAIRETLAQLQQSGLIVIDGGPQSAAKYEVKIVATEHSFVLFRPESGAPFATLTPEIKPGAPEAMPVRLANLSERLRFEWRWRRLFSLRGSSEHVQARLRIMPVSAKRDAAGQVAEDPVPLRSEGVATISLPEGTLYQIEVTNLSPTALWVTVLELMPDGSINTLFPQSSRLSDGYIAPNLGPRVMKLPYVFETTRPYGTSTLKIIATADQTDFSTLAQDANTLTPRDARERAAGMRTRASSNPLGGLLLETLSGNLVRSNVPALKAGSWSVDQALIEVPDPKAVRVP